LALQQGLREEGLGYLRKAAELASENPDIVRRVVDGMLLANEPDEARRLVRAALFRNSRDRRFLGLWRHFQFQQLRKRQGEARDRRQMAHAEQDGPVLLPFDMSSVRRVRRKGKLIRQDAAATVSAPHEAVVARMSDRRYAR
jgi:hypothetical protein